MKRFVIKIGILLTLCMSFSQIRGQNDLINEYLMRSGEFATLYSGRLRTDYNKNFYDNNPFYLPEYAEADIVYDGIEYPRQRVMLDLYTETAIVMSPESFGIVLEPEKTESVTFRASGVRFVLSEPPPDSKLNKGLFRLMYDGDGGSLLCKEKYSVIRTGNKDHFYVRKAYYYRMDGKYYQVKNGGSFRKLFPQHRQLIFQYCDKEKLNFKNERSESSLIRLAEYCGQLKNIK